MRPLDVLDRAILDLEPIGRLGDLEVLSVQGVPEAGLDLGALARLRSIAGEWALIDRTLGAMSTLESVTTWRFDRWICVRFAIACAWSA